MREKNGFIATSVLYAFLVAFLTLFLGFMASYIQNKQLMNRIGDMAREDLEKYGNVQITDLKIGDYVVLDTIYDDGIADPPTSTYTAPINPDTKWILFKIDDSTEEDGTETVTYSFVSNADAQKNKWLAATKPLEGPNRLNYSVRTGTLAPEMRYSNLNTLSELMNNNVYYDNITKTYMVLDSSVNAVRTGNYTKYFSYQFMYYINGGISVRFMTASDAFELYSLREDKVKNAIFDQRMNYTVWIDPDAALQANMEEGFGLVGYSTFTREDNVNQILSYKQLCLFNPADPEVPAFSIYQHEYSSTGANKYYDYCYGLVRPIGKCLNDTNGECGSSFAYNVRYVATIKVNKNDASTNGYIDSGNGTSALPYLITKGVK